MSNQSPTLTSSQASDSGGQAASLRPWMKMCPFAAVLVHREFSYDYVLPSDKAIVSPNIFRASFAAAASPHPAHALRSVKAGIRACAGKLAGVGENHRLRAIRRFPPTRVYADMRTQTAFECGTAGAHLARMLLESTLETPALCQKIRELARLI
jgi:hypothetical protein